MGDVRLRYIASLQTAYARARSYSRPFSIGPTTISRSSSATFLEVVSSVQSSIRSLVAERFLDCSNDVIGSASSASQVELELKSSSKVAVRFTRSSIPRPSLPNGSSLTYHYYRQASLCEIPRAATFLDLPTEGPVAAQASQTNP